MEVSHKVNIHLQKEIVRKLILAYGTEQKVYSIFTTQNQFLTLALTNLDIYNKNKTILYSSTLLNLYYYLSLEEYKEANPITILLLEYRSLFQITKTQISSSLKINLEDYIKIEEGYKKPTALELKEIKTLLNLSSTLLKKESP